MECHSTTVPDGSRHRRQARVAHQHVRCAVQSPRTCDGGVSIRRGTLGSSEVFVRGKMEVRRFRNDVAARATWMSPRLRLCQGIFVAVRQWWLLYMLVDSSVSYLIIIVHVPASHAWERKELPERSLYYAGLGESGIRGFVISKLACGEEVVSSERSSDRRSVAHVTAARALDTFSAADRPQFILVWMYCYHCRCRPQSEHMYSI